MRKVIWSIGFTIALLNLPTYAQTTMNSELAPTGKFRVGMNGNNATLVIRNADGTVSGLSADLGRFIAGKLGVPYEAVVYETSSPFTASFGKTEWDIILTGKNAVVAKLLDFSADLFMIEYVYVAAPGREFASPAQVDAQGVRIAAPRNASADVFLTRTLKSAELIRVDGDLNAGIELLRSGKVDVYSTSNNNARLMVERLPGARLVGAFNTVVFAVAMPKGRSAAAQDQLARWIAEAKAAGIVQQGLEKSAAQGVKLAP
jgi:polar amino acid transport system substrate-binding protein